MIRNRCIVVAALLALLTSVAGRGAGAQSSVPVELSGVLNDYSPSSVTGGPWEMHGQWTLEVNPWSNTADFSADLTMSGYGKTATGSPDPTQAGAGAHTHHIKLTNAKVTWNTTGCPAYSPATYGGFQISGTVSLITGNGSNAPFETTFPPTDVLQICVSGGHGNGSIPFSNIELIWGTGSPAIKHFGPQPIHGVVRQWNDQWETLRLLGVISKGSL